MANEEVSNIGVKLTLDASNFNAGMGAAQGKLNTLQQQAAKAASGVKASQASTGGAGGKTTASAAVGVTISPVELQRALTTASKGIQTIHVPIDVDGRSLTAMKEKITTAIGVVPVQIAPQFAKSGPNSPQAIIGTVFSAMGGLSPQKGQILAKQAIEQILPKRAQGGPVSSGRPVVVGDGGRPEVFRPGASGFIERDVAEFRRRAAELAALEYQISQRQRNIQHALRGARVPMLPPGTSMPPEFGTAPLREGYVRGYHRTGGGSYGEMAANLASIRQHGLRLSKAQGHLYGEPDAAWFTNIPYEEAYAVEAHLPARWFGRDRRSTDPYVIGGPSSNMAVGRDISRRRIASFSEPWMRHTRYMEREAQRSSPGRTMLQIGSTVASMRGRGYEAETQGYDQFVANAWRARHRAGGGDVYGLYGGDPAALEEEAIRHFGVTDDIREAGYLTPSGKYLDFSGRHQASGYRRVGDRWAWSPDYFGLPKGPDTLAGRRIVDHREASEILPGLPQNEVIDRMKSMGMIRTYGTWSPQGLEVGAEMSRLPTSAQLSRLAADARQAAHSFVEVTAPEGYRLGQFQTQWPVDPMGGRRMPGFLHEASERIQAHEAELMRVKESLHRGMGGMVKPISYGAGFAHRGIGGSVEAGMTKAQKSYLSNVRAAARRLSDPKNPYGRQSLEMGVQWYPEAQKWIQQQADTFNLPEPTVRGITASLSAGTAWSSNKTKALRILQAHAAGQPFPYQMTLDAHRKARAILEGANPWAVLGHTPKVGQFFLNTGGDLDAITIDRWALRTGTRGAISQAGRGPVRTGVEKAFRKVAKEMGIPPVSLQAALWIQEKAETDLAAGRTPKLAKYMAMGGPIMATGHLASQIFQTAADWASDPFMAMMAYQSQQQHRARGGRVWKPVRFGSSSAMSRMPEWYQAMYSGRGPEADYMGRQRLARDFAGPPLANVTRLEGGKNWLEIMAGERGNPYQSYITDEQWRGPEAGTPHVALPGMQDEPMLRQVLQSMALAKHQGKPPRLMASGGRTTAGLYIVNEQGDNSEGFVANRDSHLIPKFVMDRIPHAADGARTGMIRKPANSMFAPQQDGIIVPKWAVPYVPALHAQAGAQTPGRLPTGYTEYEQAASAPGAPPVKYAIPPGLEALPHILSGAAKTVEEVMAETAAADAKRATAYEKAAKAAAVPGGSPFAQQLQVSRAGVGRELPGRTARGAVTGLVSFLFGGGQELAQAQVRLAHIQQQYQKAFSTSQAVQARYTETVKNYNEAIADTSRDEGDRLADQKALAAWEAENAPKRQQAITAEKEWGKALEIANKEATPTRGGIVKNLGVIIGATALYGQAMQAANAVIQPAIEGSIKAVQSFSDQLSGFSATGSRVTKGLGDQLNATGGNLEKTFADTGLQTRMSASFTTFLEKTLGGAVIAKAASANQGQQSDLFRAALGVGNRNVATGLYGGYGGVLGTSFLGSELGGGKGFMEQIAGDVSAAAGPRGGFNPEDLGTGLLFAQNQQFRDYITGQAKQQGNGLLGGATDILGGAGDLLRQSPLLGGLVGVLLTQVFPKTQTPTQNATGGFVNPALLGKSQADQEGLSKYLGNLADEAKRGAAAMGQVSKYSYQLATSQEQLNAGTMAAARSGDAYAVSLATNGVVLVDSTGKVAQSADDFANTTQQMAKGATLPDPAVFAKTVGLSLRAAFQQSDIMSQFEIGTAIPGQLGLQLAAQPFMQARTGILPPQGAGFTGTIGGINVGQTLAKTQAAQNDLTQQGADALKALSEWIGQQPGMSGTFSTGVPIPPGIQYSAPIGPSITGAPMSAAVTIPTTSETYSSGREAFDTFTKQMADAGAAIQGWQTRIAGAQAQLQWNQYNNNLRLANRAYADARALAGQGGGPAGRMGQLEREQTLLGFSLSQKTINFQTAMAGFQAPGLTSEERAARQEQARLEAAVAQKQLNIQKGMFSEGAERGVVDTKASRNLLKQEYATQVAVAAAQRAIAVEEMKLSQAQQKAQSVLARAQGNFQGAVGTAASYVANFGGAIKDATKEIYEALGYNVSYDKSGRMHISGSGLQTTQSQTQYNTPATTSTRNAAGYLGRFARGATMTVGEAGPEEVAILRNPRAMMMGGGGWGGGGGGPVTVHLNLTVQGDVSGDATIAKIVRAVEDSFNRKAARLGMRSFVSATG